MMVGLVHVLLRWATSWRRPWPAEVVRSCSKLQGSSISWAKKLGSG